jgi:hypothetical protein
VTHEHGTVHQIRHLLTALDGKIVAYLFGGPPNYGPVPVELAWLLVGTTIFSFVVLGKRFPTFGYCTIIIVCGLLSGLRGGRR